MIGHEVSDRPTHLKPHCSAARIVLRPSKASCELDDDLFGGQILHARISKWPPKNTAITGVHRHTFSLSLPWQRTPLVDQTVPAMTTPVTAAMPSQAGAAKLLADNATLMRLWEREVLEKVACEGRLNVVLGEKGLADRIVNEIPAKPHFTDILPSGCDVLPGGTKDLMNRFTKAKKAAEATLSPVARKRPRCPARSARPSCWPTTRR